MVGTKKRKGTITVAIIVPNSASTFFDKNTALVGSADKWVWFALASGSTSACVVIYQTNASTSGCEMLCLAIAASVVTPMYGPFNSPCGIYIKAASGGSLMAWMKK